MLCSQRWAGRQVFAQRGMCDSIYSEMQAADTLSTLRAGREREPDGVGGHEGLTGEVDGAASCCPVETQRTVYQDGTEGGEGGSGGGGEFISLCGYTSVVPDGPDPVG